MGDKKDNDKEDDVALTDQQLIDLYATTFGLLLYRTQTDEERAAEGLATTRAERIRALRPHGVLPE